MSNEKRIEERYYCSNCRKELNVEQVNKRPLDFIRNEDGSLSPQPARFSVFCKQCEQFLRIIDPQVAAELQKIVDKK
jgi:ribosomal protein L44E